MAISKRTRFEVFKRDAFRCQYCGRTPPEVVLQVDHVAPRAGGGADAFDNYVTACADCNSGKSCMPLSAIPATIQQKIEVLRERQRQLEEYKKLVDAGEHAAKLQIRHVGRRFKKLTGERMPRRLRRGSMVTFVKHFTEEELIDFLETAVRNNPTAATERIIRYFCGMCWRRITGELPQ